MECEITSLKNWKKYVDTGDNSFLGDIDIYKEQPGTKVVLSGEGWERNIILDGR